MGQLSGYITLVDVSDGAPGLNNAIVYLYKRSATIPSTKPTGNLTYTFSTNTISAVESGSSLNGWVQNINSLSGTDSLYFIAATVSSTTDTDLIASTEWQGPTLLAESGEDGKGISTTTLTYGISNSSTTEPSNWYSEMPTLSQGDWLWIRTVYTYTDTTTSQFDSKSYIGTDGNDGTSVTVVSSTKVGKVTTLVMRETYADGTHRDVTMTITDGEDGSQGQPGQTGANGLTSYTHFAWTNTLGPDWDDFSITESEDKAYIGVYSDYIIDDSLDPDDYSWTLTKGEPGEDGVTITAIEYSKDGTNWSENQPTVTNGDWLYIKTTYSDGSAATSKSYIGTDGEDGTSVSIISSTKNNGVTTIVMRTTYADGTYTDNTMTIVDGEDGDDGSPGAPGSDGRTPYTHFAWANSADGTSGFSTSVSAGKQYIGIYSDYNQADSQTPSDYSWTLTKGEPGTDGFNQAILYLYQRASSTPSVPVGDLTYTFATGVLSGTLGNWTREIPSNSSGYPCYVITAAAISRNSTDTILSTDWSNPVILVEDGTNGAPGINTATVYLYQRSASAPNKPSNELTYTFSTAELTPVAYLGNWKQSIGELTGNDPIWVIAAVANSTVGYDNIDSDDWSTQIQMAQDGTPGSPGYNQATVFIYKRAATATTPSNSTYTFATGSFTTPSGWQTTIPASSSSNKNPCWVSSAVAIGYEATATLVWNTPSILVENGADGFSPVVTTTSTGVKIVDAEGNETYINNGAAGQTYYTYVRYATDSSGSNMSASPTGKTYIGVYSGTSSTAPTTANSYTWSKYVGTDATQYYAFVKYATDANGSNMRDTPGTGYDYVGTYTGTNSSPSASLYKWSKYTGEPGQPATQYYAFVKYATSSAGANMQDSPDSTHIYVGTYTGTKANPSASDYRWSLYKGTSVTGVKEVYRLKRTTDSTPTKPQDGTEITSTSTDPNVWTTVVPAYIEGATYYTSVQTSLSAGTSPIFSPAVINQGLTDSNSKAWAAYNLANNTDTLLGGHFYYYPSTSTSTKTRPSANVIQFNSVLDDPTQWGHNVHIGSNGIALRYNEATLSSWSYNTTTQKASIQIGKDSSSRFIVGEDSLTAYNGSNNQYFSVSASGIKYGANLGTTVATTSDVTNATSGLATQTALNNEINARKAKYGTQSSNSSDAGNQTKAIACANFELIAGNEITIYFKYANTYASNVIKLNVNNTGATNVWVANAVTSSTNQLLWGEGAYITFMYDGSKFIVQGEPRTWSGASSTAATTAAKTDTTAVTGCVICKGTTVNMQMTNANSVSNPTLNIRSTGAKTIYAGANNTALTNTSTNNWTANSIVPFVFDGQYWRYDINAITKANAAQSDADNASYSVEIEVNELNLVNNSIKLIAHPYYKGTRMTNSTVPALSTISYRWQKNGSNLSNTSTTPTISGATTSTLILGEGTDFGSSNSQAVYTCVISN